MSLDIDLTLKAISVGIALVGAWATNSKRPKLISYLVNSSAVEVGDGKRVHTHAVVVRNNGRSSATNVRLVHRNLPEHFSVYPRRKFDVERYEGGADILLGRIVPNEQVTVNYIYAPPLTVDQVHEHLKSDEGFAEIISVVPSRVFSRPTRWLVVVMLLTGVATWSYLLLVAAARVSGLIAIP